MVREIDNQPAVSLPTVITTALSRANIMLEDLGQLMQVKWLKSADGLTRTRRRAWARNKSNVNRAKSEAPCELPTRLSRAAVGPRLVWCRNDDTDAALLLNGEGILSRLTTVIMLSGFELPGNRTALNRPRRDSRRMFVFRAK